MDAFCYENVNIIFVYPTLFNIHDLIHVSAWEPDRDVHCPPEEGDEDSQECLHLQPGLVRLLAGHLHPLHSHGCLDQDLAIASVIVSLQVE